MKTCTSNFQSSHLLNFAINKVRGQCYDSASAMVVCKCESANLIMNEKLPAIYTHCYGHALNFIVVMVSKVVCAVIKYALDVTDVTTKLPNFSSRHDAISDRVKKELEQDIVVLCVLCPTW